MKMQSKTQWTLLGLWLRKMWQGLLDGVARQSEPKVWQSVDRSGNLRWNVYHPGTRESAVLDSEQEVRIWLEQSFYR
ncbi:hypothetical protein [Stenomitos frigidus]|uniref:Uncharacterized protein n=1 Tax=Stenomitos frigidus ULC18 TaxID=2107698 RepID=A0A2T1EBE5_9CYAN|nr:hypothetical protein [Stenomitos frigidus]PSB30028.1 hypothetical protein C7B82_09655 [Stenomitos frigidus ULC18]